MGGVDELLIANTTPVNADEIHTGFVVDDLDCFADFVVDHNYLLSGGRVTCTVCMVN